MARYVPKTYNNRRLLRIIVGTGITIALLAVILFLVLFFVFSQYVVDGKLEIPWLLDDTSPTAPAVTEPREDPDDSPDEETSDEVTVDVSDELTVEFPEDNPNEIPGEFPDGIFEERPVDLTVEIPDDFQD